MENNDIKYVERIKKQYSEKEKSKIDELRSLDKKVKRGANIFAYVFGVVGSLVLGFGMCIAMQIILKQYMILGIIVGVVGILIVSINYLLYKKILTKSKKKYSNEIIELSNEILN